MAPNLMTCKNLEGLITEYLEEALSPSARADFEAHLAACPDCRKRLDETRTLIKTSHDLGGKLSQEWRTRAAGEGAEQFLETSQGRVLGEPRAAKDRYKKLAAAAAAVAVVIAIAAGVWFHVENARRSAVPLSLTVDLTQQGPLRGAEQPKEVPVVFSRRILNLKILMPIGSGPGKYGVAIWRDGKILVEVEGPGILKNGITTVRVRLDCRRLSKGSYKLLTRFDHWSWENFPMVIR